MLCRPRGLGTILIHQFAPLRGCSASRGRQRALRLQIGQDAGTAFDAIADFHIHASRAVQQDIDARSEFDQSHALAAIQTISQLGREHDSPRQQPRNLLEDDLLAVALHSHNILLIFLGGDAVHGVQILAPLVANIANYSCDRGTVYMHIKNVEKNADPHLPLVSDGHDRNVGDFAVTGGNDCSSVLWNLPLGITKEPEKEHGQQAGDDRPNRLCQPA